MINVNQITATLAKLPDQSLQRYAMMHKDDPYIMSLALAESNRRKEMRSGAQMQMQQQPKVVDQAIEGMAAVDPMGNYMGTPLPEDVGIGRLPAKNLAKMAGGGIVAFADGGETDDMYPQGQSVLRMSGGGVAHYYRGGKTNQDFTSLILETAKKYGIDPDVAMRLVKQESGFNPNAKSKKGAVGLTQLMPDTAEEMGLSKDERADPVKNLEAGFGYLRKQLDKYGGDYSKALTAYNWGPGNADKHLTKHKGEVNRGGLPKETADYLNKILPIGSAGAAEKPQPRAASENIPGYTPRTEEQIRKDTEAVEARDRAAGFMSPEWFQSKAESLGLSRDTGRQVYNTLMAPTPLTPAAQVPTKASGIAALGEKLYQRFSPAARAEQQGLKALQEAQAVRQVAEDAKALQAAKTTDVELAQAAQMAGAMPGEARLAADATRGIEAAQAARAAQVPSAAEKIQAASVAREAQHAATVPRVAQVAQGVQQVAQIPEETRAVLGGDKAGLPSLGSADETDYSAFRQEFDPMTRLTGGAGTPADIASKIPGAAAPKGEAKDGLASLFNDPLFTMGMRLMAARSPFFLQNVGEAGVGTAADIAARKKAEMEEKYYGALSKRAEALAKTEGLTGNTQLAYFLGEGDTPEARVRSGYPVIQAMTNQMKAMELDADVQKMYWTYAAKAAEAGQEVKEPRVWAMQNRAITAFNNPKGRNTIIEGQSVYGR